MKNSTGIFAAPAESGTEPIATATADNGIACIDLDEVIASMSEMKSAQQELKNAENRLSAQISEMQAEFIKNLGDNHGMTDDARQLKLKELQALIEQKTLSAQKEMATLRQELLMPLHDKAAQAVEQVKAAGGFSVVLHKNITANGDLSNTTDITAQVKQRLSVFDVEPVAPSVAANTLADNRVAYVDFNEVLFSMPELNSAEQVLANTRNRSEAEIKAELEAESEKARVKITKKYKYSIREYTSQERIILSENEHAKELDRIIDQQYAPAMQELQKKLEKLWEELIPPIRDKVQQAIEQVTAAGGFATVLYKDRIANGDLSNMTDITPQVKRRLGINPAQEQ